MLYLVRTLKEYDGKRVNTDFVLETPDEQAIREFLGKHKVIILSISQVTDWPGSAQHFGTFQGEEGVINFCLKSDSIKSAIERCLNLDLPLIEINDKLNPIPLEESKNIIQRLQQQKQEKEELQQQNEEKIRLKRKKVIDDKKKEKIMQIVADTLHDIRSIEQTYQNNPALDKKRRQLTDLKEQLTKIKMGSNIEKASSILESTFSLLEEIEIVNISLLKEEESILTENSTVSNVDIISELEKLKRAQQTSLIGGKKSKSDLYYTFLGPLGLYQKFLAKDIFHKVINISQILDTLIEYARFTVLCITVNASLLFLYFSLTQSLTYNLFIVMISLGISGIVAEILKAVHSPKTIVRIIYIILAIIAIFAIQKGVIIFFALL